MQAGAQSGAPRYIELLDALRNEYESISHEITSIKHHREDSESKGILSSHKSWIHKLLLTLSNQK